MRLMRSALLTVSRYRWIKNVMMAVPLTRDVVARFVPGETVDEVVASLREAREKGLLATLDCLGEDTLDLQMAEDVTQAYVALLGRLKEEGLAETCEVSVKLSAVGQFLGADGEAVALANARRICQAAREVGTTVTLDMEDHTTTDSTLRILDQLRPDYPETGCVLQSYLKRTEDDCRRMAALDGQRVRLCKGAYEEPAAVAYQDKTDVDLSYVRCLKILMNGKGYPMVASHDPRMIAIAEDLAQRAGRDEQSYEFQMLYGIRAIEQERLARVGHQVRIYTPFGTDWYGYFTRRLAERPANLVFFLRSFLGRR